VNYRLAPQYPFPCALHDLLAACEYKDIMFSSLNIRCADLFLIRPPADAAHCAVSPSHIVIAGDSAGGGLSLALLQVIRDAELPMPAGGVLISPWCDLTHSFPSVLTNTATVSPSISRYILVLTGVMKGCYTSMGTLSAET
jgi:acetyl esterase/lipase